MKKTLIASAIAAATLTSNAFAMDPATDLAEMLEGMPTIYGNIQLYHASNTTEVGSAETSTNELSNGGSTLGFTHDHMISDGLTGFMKAEFEFQADDKGSSTGLSKLDEAYIGVKGDFGMAQVGSDDTVYDWIDMIDTSEQIGLGGGIAFQDQGDNFQYVSPEIVDGLMLGLTAPIDSDTRMAGILAAKYSMDSLSVALSYAMGREDSVDNVLVEAGDTIGLGVSFGIDDITLLAQFETKSEGKIAGLDAKDDSDYMAFQGMYAMGQNTFALGYGVKSYGDTLKEDESKLYLQALHSLSDNMYAFLEYAMTTDVKGAKGTDSNDLAIGAVYAF
jgi:predicted porin